MSALIGPEIYEANRPGPAPFEDDPERYELVMQIIGSPARVSIMQYMMYAQNLGFHSLDPDIMRRAIRAGEIERPDAVVPAYPEPEYTCDPVQPVVYYMMIGQMVKIGTSANLVQRIDQIGPMDVLAVEAGGVEVERERHRQFGRLRCHREWFYFRGDLPAHIGQMRAQFEANYGEPFDDWLDRLWPSRRLHLNWPRDTATGAPLFGV